jgi:hypothetical protein
MGARRVVIDGVFLPHDKMHPPIAGTLDGNMYDPGLGVGGGPVYPPEGGGESPPGIWGPTDPRPTPPIYFPPGGGGGGGPGGRPEHPIAGPPDHIWGPTDPRPTPPIYLPPGTIPGFPSHPIVIPPGEPGEPTHPIVLPPPGGTEPPQVLKNWEVKTYWSASTGWGVAIVPSESHPGVPTPSAKP